MNGTASITYLNVSYESASVIYSSGSNQFGDASNDTQTLYGTVIIPTGSLTVSGALAVSSSQNSYFVGGSNVGIGTNVPMGPLEVYKSTPAGLGGHIILSNDGSSVGNETAVIFNDSGVGSVGFVRAAISSTTEGSPFSGDIKFKTGNTSYGSLSTRMIVTGAGNVGIGTTTPAVVLDVHKSLDSSYIRINSAGNYETGYQIYNSGAIKWQMYVPNSSNDLRFYDGFDNRVTFQYGGNVGIGTLSPTSIISGTERTLQIENSNVASIYLNATSGNKYALYSAASSNSFAIYDITNATIRFMISGSGAIKLGAYGSGTFTGTAAQKLAVDSSGNLIEIPIGAGPVDGSGTANYITRWVDTDTITTSSIYETGSNIGIGNTTPSYKLDVTAASTSDGFRVNLGGTSKIIANGDGVLLWGTGANQGALTWDSGKAIVYGLSGNALSLGANGSYDQLYINTSGNVGIGTITPAYKLSVVGKIALNDGGNSLFIGDNAGQLDDATANVNVGVGYNALQNNLTGNQNVAIGHKAAATQTAAANNTAVGANALELNTTGASTTAIGSYALNNNIVGTSNTAVGTAALLFNTSGSRNIAIGSSAGRLNTSGSRNVSIGTAALYENVTGSNNIALGDNAARYFGSGTSALTDTSGSIIIGSNARANANGSLNEIVIGTDLIGLGSNTVVLGNDNVTTTVLKGNVGIGTTSPSYKLHVNTSDTSANVIGVTNGTQTLTLGVNNSSGGSFLFENGSNALRFGTAGSERMRIDSSGNVGIGTTSPSYLLDVNGTARVTTLIETSAAKYKTNIQPLESQLSKVTQLEPVTFDWIDKPNHKTNIGLIADEVEKIYPEFVSKTEDGEIEGIEYSKLTTVLIQSIKELKEIVDKQQEQINTLLNK